MNNFNKLLEIVESLKKASSCNGGSMSINFNEHLTVYESIDDYILSGFYDGIDDEDFNIMQKCKKDNNLVEIRVYPATPVGHIYLFDSNLENASKRMIEALMEDPAYLRIAEVEQTPKV